MGWGSGLILLFGHGRWMKWASHQTLMTRGDPWKKAQFNYHVPQFAFIVLFFVKCLLATVCITFHFTLHSCVMLSIYWQYELQFNQQSYDNIHSLIINYRWLNCPDESPQGLTTGENWWELGDFWIRGNVLTAITISQRVSLPAKLFAWQTDSLARTLCSWAIPSQEGIADVDHVALVDRGTWRIKNTDF